MIRTKKRKKGRKKSRKKTGKEIGKVTPHVYWKFRLATEAWEHEQTRLKLCIKAKELHNAELVAAQSKVEIAQLKLGVCQKVVKDHGKTVQSAQNEYNEMLKELETDIGHSVINVVIEPETFIVSKLNE